MTWSAQNRNLHRGIANRQRNQISIFEIHFFRRAPADQSGVIPGQLRDRIRSLHQPTIIGKTTIVGSTTRGEQYLKTLRIRHISHFTRNRTNTHCISTFLRQRRTLGKTVAQRLRPIATNRSESFFHCVQTGLRIPLGISQQRQVKIIFRNTTPQRIDHRLLNRVNPGMASVITPTLQIVSTGNVPARSFRRGIHTRANMNQLHAFFRNQISNTQIGRSIEQQVTFTGND